MKKILRRLTPCAVCLTAAALWSLLDESMLLLTAMEPAAARVPAVGETVEFVFPWLEGLLRWLHL